MDDSILIESPLRFQTTHWFFPPFQKVSDACYESMVLYNLQQFLVFPDVHAACPATK